MGDEQKERLQKVATQNEPLTLTVNDFLAGIHEGKLKGVVCRNCGHKQIDVIEFCPVCHESHFHSVTFSGEGRVATYTIQFVAPEQFMNEVPYAWAVIDLDEGPRITGWIPFISKSEDLPIGQRVRFCKSYLPGMVFEKI